MVSLETKIKPSASSHESVVTDSSQLIAVPLESIPLDESLPYPIYVKVQDRFVFFRPAGDKVTTRRAGSLGQMAYTVYIPKTNWIHYVSSLEKRFQGPGVNPVQPFSHMDVRHLCMAYLKDAEEKRELFLHEIGRYQAGVDRLAVLIDSDPSSAKELIRRSDDISLYFSNHGVNTAVYSLLIGKSLGFSLDQLKKLATAAFYHNIGNIQLPPELVNKPGALSSAEANLVRTHTLKGARILDRLGFAMEIVQTAMQHHEHIDGSGYPLELRSESIHPFAKICAVAQIYDRMQSRNSYQEPVNFEAAQRKVLENARKYDARCVSVIITLDF